MTIPTLQKAPDNEIFVFHYRPRFRPVEDFVRGPDLKTVKQKCIEYCNKHGITFISVRPFFLDLEKPLRDKRMLQPGTVVEEISVSETPSTSPPTPVGATTEIKKLQE